MCSDDRAARRAAMTVRKFRLGEEPEDALMAGTVAERLQLVAQLSETGWALTGRPLPTYTRATIPVVVLPMRCAADGD